MKIHKLIPAIILTILLITLTAKCQDIKNGLYFSKYTGSWNAGYFWFYNDTSFVQVEPYFNTADTCIETIGFGTKLYNPISNSVIFRFRKINFSYYYPTPVKYTASSKEPFDSIIILVNLTRIEKFRLYPNPDKIKISNPDGKCRIALPWQERPDLIKFSGSRTRPIIFNLSEIYNYHKFEIKFCPDYRQSGLLIEYGNGITNRYIDFTEPNGDEWFKGKKTNKGYDFFPTFFLSEISEKPDEILNLIANAKKNQRNYIQVLDWLENEIKSNK